MLPAFIPLLFFVLLSACSTQTQSVVFENSISIIPLPQHISRQASVFVFNTNTAVFCPSKKVEQEFILLKELFKEGGISLNEVAQLPQQNYIEIELKDTVANTKSEKYHLNIDSTRIRLTAYSPVGVFWGIQTLRQLLPTNFSQPKQNILWAVPAVDIIDFPVFEWRGMLLDCCRHFFEKEVIKKYIDCLAFYKMNTLHWHLTEDQGWRLAIDAYPRLTAVGAYRKEADSTIYGDFYSKSDVQEIVAYAKQRHISIVPEIEMPGHSQAAIAAYPHLSCTGQPITVANKWGVFKDVYCAGNDQTFEFLEKVLLEVFALFPSEYIHIGGDECPKFRWENCSKCQNRMQAENLKDEAALQSYFINRMAAFLEKHQKKLIGWDEILEGGLAPNAIVQSWRGMNGAKEAALSGHYAIASPTSHAYFDYDLQAIDLEKVYSFDPVPSGLNAQQKQFIKGGECNMWTERVPDEKTLDAKVFPRLLAMSEVLWTYPRERNYEDFYQRVQGQYPFLELKKIGYGAETIPVKAQVYTSKQSMNVKLLKGSPDLTLKYSFNDTVFQVYEGILSLQNSGTLAVQAFKNNQRYGTPFARQFRKHLGNGIVPELGYTYSSFYTGGGPQALTNGIRGTLDFRDGNWQAVQKESMEIILDLGALKSLKQLSTAFFQKQDSWIFLPEKVDFFIGTVAGNFQKVGTVKNDISPKESKVFIKNFSLTIDAVEARYIKLVAFNIGHCPDWHAAPGSEAWLFIDELVVE